MSELLREAVQGPVGKRIQEDLDALHTSLNEAVLRSVRDDTKSYHETRYTLGVADGVRIALNHIMGLGQNNGS